MSKYSTSFSTFRKVADLFKRLPDSLKLLNKNVFQRLLPSGSSDSKLCLSTHWMAPDLEACSFVVETIPDLDHVEVTDGMLHT